jgi:hypothetical protein
MFLTCDQGGTKEGRAAERLVGNAFTAEELRILFEKEEFRTAVTKIQILEDAGEVVDLGSKLLVEKIKDFPEIPEGRR